MTQPKRLIAYTRVSTDEQSVSGLGLRAQRTTIEQGAPARGYVVVDWAVDGGYSGGLPPEKRPALCAALASLARGDAEGIVVAKLDRLSRSLTDFVHLVEKAKLEGWELVILDLGVDTSEPNGRFLASVIASVAQLERDLISQRTRNALAAKRAAGWVPRGGKSTTPPEVVAFIHGARNRRMTLQQIADDLNTRDVPTSRGGSVWRPSSVRSVLLTQVDPATRA